jgi:hypothetical protein
MDAEDLDLAIIRLSGLHTERWIARLFHIGFE